MAKQFDTEKQHEKQQSSIPAPMLSRDVLEQEIINTKLSKRSKHLPENTLKAAMRWIQLQEKPKAYEKPRQVMAKEGQYWVTPYTQRLIETYRKFIQLTHDEQQIVISCHEDGVFWRGDDMAVFIGGDSCIYEQTMRMRADGVEKYRAESRAIIAECIAKMEARAYA